MNLLKVFKFLLKINNAVLYRLSVLKTFITLKSYKSEELILGDEIIFKGTPIFKIFPNSKIQFGGNCLINSSYSSNPAGVMMPSTFATIKEGAEIVIGNNVGISGTSIVAASKIIIEDEVQIGAGVCIWDNDFHPIDPNLRLVNKTDHYQTKEVHIGRNVFIGARSIILKGVKIGDNSVIGAGSVVVTNIPPNSIYAGNPARFIKNI